MCKKSSPAAEIYFFVSSLQVLNFFLSDMQLMVCNNGQDEDDENGE